MIIPFFSRIFSFELIPSTWFLVILNAFFFLALFEEQNAIQSELESFFKNESVVQTQAYVFYKHVHKKKESYKPFLSLYLNKLLKQGDIQGYRSMASLSIHDPQFSEMALNSEFSGDKVALKEWKQSYKKFLTRQKQSSTYIWGLSFFNQNWPNWITYQFIHGGFVHFLGNVFFLVVFGAFLELMLGSFVFLFIYLFSGVVAGISFQILTGLSTLPLVGASGSISALMALFIILVWNRNVRFFFWALPFRGYYGFIYLPAWITAIIWLLTDLTGFISSFNQIGGVAYAAHIGGAIVGTVFGLLIKTFFNFEYPYLVAVAK